MWMMISQVAGDWMYPDTVLIAVLPPAPYIDLYMVLLILLY